ISECLGESGVDYDKDCHECINTIGSYTCRCDDGYKLHSNGTSCQDIDECERGMYEVDCHICVNLIGGFTCLCNDTYMLDANNNNETCISMDIEDENPGGSAIGIAVGLTIFLILVVIASVVTFKFVKQRREDKLMSSEDDQSPISGIPGVNNEGKKVINEVDFNKFMARSFLEIIITSS
ncbi:hypothetical protein CAPTEDRAFT_207106, partial [Capitella teleta]